MKICITGANGYIGRVVTKILLEKTNHELVLIDQEFMARHIAEGFLDGIREYEQRIHIIGQKIRYHDTYSKDENAIKECDLIIHLAALISVPESEHFDEYYIKNNVIDYRNFLKNVEPKKIFYASSASVYGEDGSIDPKSVYADTKLLGEFLTKRYCDDYRILRFANPVGVSKKYGHDQIKDRIRSGYPNVFWILANCKKNNKIFKIHDNPNMFRDFFPVETIAFYILDLIEDRIPRCQGDVYDVGSGVLTNVVDFLTDACKKHNIAYQMTDPPPGTGNGYVATEVYIPKEISYNWNVRDESVLKGYLDVAE